MIGQSDKEKLLQQKAVVIWITGLSGSGKTTLANNIEKELFKKGFLTQVLDGDHIRHSVNSDLCYTIEDREENIRRIAEISKLFLRSGIICIVSVISPTIKIRQIAKEIIGKENFIEVFLSTPLIICEQRDIKGLYANALSGRIENFTGISSPYEIPITPDIEINTQKLSKEVSLKRCIQVILPRIVNISDNINNLISGEL